MKYEAIGRNRPEDASARRTARLLLASTMLVGLSTAARAQDAADAGTVVLDAISVTGASYETEGSDSYTTDLVSVGEKEAVPVREIPQSTYVLTRERLEDGNYTSLDTALRQTPGIVVLNNDDGRSSIFQRGFEFDTLYFNGLPAPLSSIYGTQPDMAIVDHVEILRGPAGLFGGAGEPAGAINMRLKQAMSHFQGYVSGSLGSWQALRGEADVTGPLNAAGTVRGRVVGALQTEDSWVDTVTNGVGVAYGTIQADIGDGTTATLSISHMRRDITPFNGLPTYADGTLIDLNRSTYTGADWNNFENDVTDYIAEIEHKFDDGGHAKASARYSDREVEFLYAYAAGAADAAGNVNGMRWLARDFTERSLAVDAHVSKPFELFGQEHNVLVGADYQHVSSTMYQGAGLIPGTFNLYNWNSAVPEPTVNYTTRTKTEPDKFGVYGQLRARPVDRLTLIGGGRFSWYDASTTNLVSGAVTSTIDVDGKFTPYAGAVLDLTEAISAYASFTEIFQPQTETDIDGNMLAPREGRQYEAGLKGEFLDGGLNASVAYFNLRDTNRAIPDPNNPGAFIAQGEVEVQGVELEATGAILPNWQVAAGYTYTSTEYLNGSEAGQTFSTYTPKHMFQLWTKYRFESDRWWDGIYVGGGLKAYSDFYNISQGVTIRAPGYVVVDLMAGRDITEHLTASLTVNNVFDETYYARVGGTSVFNFCGEPRSATFRLKATF